MKKTVARLVKDPKMRAAYRDRRRAQVHEWSAKLDLWTARARKAKADATIRYRDQLADLRDALDAMSTRLDEMERATGDSWVEIRARVDEVATEAKEIVDRVSDRLDR